MSATSYRITDDLFLVDQKLSSATPKKVVETNTNHLLVFDCSGSMYGVLEDIRDQIKNKLPTMAKPGDTVSILWFSGRGQFGVLVEGHVLTNITDFSKLNATIDRWLRPVGLTGFKEPLESVLGVVQNLAKNGFPFSLMFLTDGYDNQWREPEILDVCDKVGVHVQATTIVEFGFYCNRPLLTKMAERMGGSLIFSENFAEYEPTFDAVIQRRPLGGKKIAVEVEAPFALGDLVWSFDGNPIVYRINDGEVAVNEGLDRIVYLSETPVGTEKKFSKDGPAAMDVYVGMAVFAQRMNANIVMELLKASGDVRFIKQFTNCFGKQSYSTFQKDVLEAANEPSMRLNDGYDPKLVPPDDAFTVLDVLAILALDEKNLFYPKDPSFGYQRIGRKAEAADSRLTEAEQKELAELTAKAKSKADLAKVTERLTEIIASKPVDLKFTADEENPGVPVLNLVTNSTRPNISVLVTLTGTVDLTPLYADEKNAAILKKAKVPVNFPTKIYRNFAIIADGIVNTKKLPVSLTKGSFDELVKQGLLPAGRHVEGKIYQIDLTHIPVVNRKMVQEASAKTLFENEYEAMRLKAGNKIINEALNRTGGGDHSTGIATIYGKEVADLLAANNVTDRGYNQRVVLAEAVDTYIGRELTTKLAGLSSLPKTADVRKKLTDKKPLTISMNLINEWLPIIDKFEAELPDETERRKVLQEELVKNRDAQRALSRSSNEIKFAVVVGQVWFKEFDSLDQNSMAIKTPFGEIECSATLSETEFKR